MMFTSGHSGWVLSGNWTWWMGLGMVGSWWYQEKRKGPNDINSVDTLGEFSGSPTCWMPLKIVVIVVGKVVIRPVCLQNQVNNEELH